MVLFSPVRGGGGGEGIDYGHKGKGGTHHQIIDANGSPLVVLTTPASWSEQQQVRPMLRKIQKWTRQLPDTLCADRGYDSDKLRNMLRYMMGMHADFDRRQYDAERRGKYRITMHAKRTGRWKVERSFSWLYRRYARVTQRKERTHAIFKAFSLISLTFFWVERLVEVMG